MNRSVSGFDDESLEALCRYTYPGNIRELENVMERAVVLAEDDVIHICDLPDEIRFVDICNKRPVSSKENVNYDHTLPEAEEVLVRNALAKCNGNQSKAAKVLGITREQIKYRVKKYNIPIPSKLAH